MKKLLCLMGGAMSIISVVAQTIISKEALSIGGRLPEITFNNILNYDDGTAKLSDFQDNKSRVVIFDFWFTNCGSCVELFPKLDSLQKQFNRQIQIVLVAHESKSKVVTFIKGWENKHHAKFNLPIITGDTTLHKLFPHLYESHEVWIAPDNIIVAQSTPDILNADILRNYLKVLPAQIVNRGFLKTFELNQNKPTR